MNILIVKTSSLGDVIQALIVLDYLKQKFPNSIIDWVVRSDLISLMKSHPLVDHVIELSITGIAQLRKKNYDIVFDLQGNTKSGLVTFLSKSKKKVGYGKQSVREWPNLLSTHIKYNIAKNQNISEFYLGLIKKHFQDNHPFIAKKILLNISSKEKNDLLQKINLKKVNIMVCPGSKWENKKLSIKTLIKFLQLIQTKYACHFYLSSGSDLEKKSNNIIQKTMGKNVTNLYRMPVPVWQNFISMMDLMIAVDSSSLHLCSTTDVASFSIFGPTSSDVFKPQGKNHHCVQGKCLYGKKFIKQCPILRTCKTGACIKNIDSQQIFQSFIYWVNEQNILIKDQN